MQVRSLDNGKSDEVMETMIACCRDAAAQQCGTAEFETVFDGAEASNPLQYVRRGAASGERGGGGTGGIDHVKVTGEPRVAPGEELALAISFADANLVAGEPDAACSRLDSSRPTEVRDPSSGCAPPAAYDRVVAVEDRMARPPEDNFLGGQVALVGAVSIQVVR